MTSALDPAKTYLHLTDGPDIQPIEVDDRFWATIGERADLHEGRLLMGSTCAEPWSTWEMHPEGDEVIVLVSGAVDFVLERDDGEEIVALDAHAVTVVPRGVWHTCRPREPSRLLIITRGAGTQHRPV